MANSIYNQPHYYETAFSFIDPQKQVDLFEDFISQYSDAPVKKVLDIGCGPSLQLRELAKRGYTSMGLDLSAEMLDHLKNKAEEEGFRIKTYEKDMKSFSLEEKIDFAFIMMGTIGNFKSNEEMYSHLNSIADNLKSGGLYLIENFSLDWREKVLFKPQEWVVKKNGLKITTTFSLELKDVKKQLLKERLVFEVDDNGVKKSFKESSIVKLIFPQEFLEIVKKTGKFEFIGWFDRNSTEHLEAANQDNVAILKRV